MAFLLISAIDQKNRLKGDVITVKDDNVWGRMETLPNFVRIEVPLLLASQLSHLLEDLTDDADINIQQAEVHRDKVATPLHRTWMLPASIVDATIAAGGVGMATADAFVERN